MPPITKDLIKRRAEHADGILPDLEELSMHQFEIEKIEVVGDLCHKLKILYLQNNIIGRMENMHHLKDLEYLNLALNNITLIEGLSTCEFLNKLDMTVNFIDVDTFEASIEHLKQHRALRELYLMGNPAADWPGHRAFVAAALPQLECLDGKDFKRTERILALQQMPRLTVELRRMAAAKRTEKAAAAAAAAAAPPKPPKKRKKGVCKHGVKNCAACTNRKVEEGPDGCAIEVISERFDGEEEEGVVEDDDGGDGDGGGGGGGDDEEDDEDDMCEWTPEARVDMYRELAEQKAEEEATKNRNKPKDRNYQSEHDRSVAEQREKEAAVLAARADGHGRADDAGLQPSNPMRGDPNNPFDSGRLRQCNEPGLEFHFDEDRANVYVTIHTPRHMDTSLIDADVQPYFVSVIIKGKTIRLELPEEVQPGAGTCQRSKASGHMKFSLPKLKAGGMLKSYKQMEREKKEAQKRRMDLVAEKRAAAKLGMQLQSAGGDAKAALLRRKKANPMAVDLRGIYSGQDNPNLQQSERLKEHVGVATAAATATTREKFGVLGIVDDSMCPPLE